METDLTKSSRLFGSAVVTYAQTASNALIESEGHTYSFVETEQLLARWRDGRIAADEVNRVIVAEAIDMAHMAAVTSVFRAFRWMETAWREAQANNIYGFANALRGLLEAVGDAALSLGGLGITFAENRTIFSKALDGKIKDAVITMSTVEEALIHYGHGRRLTGAEKREAAPLHIARTSTEYVDFFAQANLPEARQLYKRLCELGHPSRSSIDFLYEASGPRTTRLSLAREQVAVDELLEHREVWEALPSMAFNPGLLILRVLDAYGRFPPVLSLREFDFQRAPIWKRINRHLLN